MKEEEKKKRNRKIVMGVNDIWKKISLKYYYFYQNHVFLFDSIPKVISKFHNSYRTYSNVRYINNDVDYFVILKIGGEKYWKKKKNKLNRYYGY